MQTSFAVDTYMVNRLAEDPRALAGKLALFMSPDRQVVLMTRLGATAMHFDGPGGPASEHILALPFGELAGRHVMGMAVGLVNVNDEKVVATNLIVWENRVPMRYAGSLLVLETADEDNLRMFWMRTEPGLGAMPWRTIRFANAPLELIGTSMRYALTSIQRLGKDPGPVSMQRVEVLGLYRLSDSRVAYVVKDAAGQVFELHHGFGEWKCVVPGQPPEYATVTFPNR